MGNWPNIILLTADSLRADCLGCYGSEGPSLTPHIDDFARRNVLFTDVYAQGPYTAFSLPSLFTGKLPCRLRPMPRTLKFEPPAGLLVEGTTTFVEVLREAGYHTAAFHSNPLASRLFGFDKGFDVFFDDILASSSKISPMLKFTVARFQRVVRPDPFLVAHKLNQKVLTWLEGASQPFFLWVHYMDTHGPYLPRKTLRYVSHSQRLWRKCQSDPERITPAECSELQKSYQRQITALDAELARLWQGLEQKGLMKDSLVILSADHGEEFGEHGGYGHTHKVYDELLHVPLIARLPGADPSIHRGLTALIQIAPTILDFAGLLRDHTFDTASLLPALTGQRYSPHPYVLAEAGTYAHENVTIRTPGWKLIWKREGAEKELYDLVNDPREQENLASERPDIIRELEPQLLAHREDMAHPHAVAVSRSLPEMTQEEEEIVAKRLRDLGYL